MLEWIDALKEEMKPMLDSGGKHEALSNGRGPSAKPPAKKGKTDSDVKVDPLAFNEVSDLQ